MFYLGTALIIFAIISTIAATVCYGGVIAGRTRWLRWGRASTYAALGFAAASALLLLLLFLMQRYDIRYVYDYSSSELELRYRMAAVWAGQPGSLVVWALVGLCCAPWLMRSTRHFEPYILTLLMSLQAILLVFMLIRNPFIPTVLEGAAAMQGMPPVDGRGLNPQLHNVWMVIHPPTLFTGYGLLGVAFCIALAGLWRRDYDGWVRLALPWMLAGWTVLGLALAMGGYWAYESLGWGGYWAWDPVETSALLPWLTGTALIHGLLVQRTNSSLRRSNLFLAIATYGFVLFASFLTRSGVLGSFSVHSFVEEGLKHIMLGSMTTIVSLGLLLLIVRWRDIPSQPLSETLLSRHTAFTLMILTFGILAIITAVGTSLPWVTSFPGVSDSVRAVMGSLFEVDDGTRFNGQPFGDGRFALMPDFFKRTSSPMALILAMLMSVGPILGWRSTEKNELVRTLRWPFVAAVLAVVVGMLIGIRDLLSIAFLFFCVLAIGTNGLMIARTLRRGWLRIGGYLAHVGMAILLVGVIGSYGYSSADERMVIPQGKTQRMFGHDFTFWGYESRPDGKHGMRLEVDRDSSSPFVAQPEIFFNNRMQTWVRTPAIKRTLWKDLYISPEEYMPADDPNALTLARMRQGEIGPYQLRFDEFKLEEHMTADQRVSVGATLTITRENRAEVLTPWLRVSPEGMISSLPIPLGNGRDLLLEQISVNSDQVRVRITGLNLPVAPARAVLTVSTKPAIALVWLGTIVMVLGGCLAMLRRRRELVPVAVSGERRLPKPNEPRIRGWGLPGWRGVFTRS